ETASRATERKGATRSANVEVAWSQVGERARKPAYVTLLRRTQTHVLCNSGLQHIRILAFHLCTSIHPPCLCVSVASFDLRSSVSRPLSTDRRNTLPSFQRTLPSNSTSGRMKTATPPAVSSTSETQEGANFPFTI